MFTKRSVSRYTDLQMKCHDFALKLGFGSFDYILPFYYYGEIVKQIIAK